MIIHISRERYDAILGQSLPCLSKGLTPPSRFVERGDGDNEIHLIDGERAVCLTCGEERESVDAWSPADWEYVKMSLREVDPARAAKILDYMREERKQRDTAHVMLTLHPDTPHD